MRLRLFLTRLLRLSLVVVIALATLSYQVAAQDAIDESQPRDDGGRDTSAAYWFRAAQRDLHKLELGLVRIAQVLDQAQAANTRNAHRHAILVVAREARGLSPVLKKLGTDLNRLDGRTGADVGIDEFERLVIIMEQLGDYSPDGEDDDSQQIFDIQELMSRLVQARNLRSSITKKTTSSSEQIEGKI